MIKNNHEQKIDPKVKEVLILLGASTFLAASIIFPGLPIIAKNALKLYEESKREKENREWEKFNLWRLRQLVKRMQNSKYIEISEEDGTQTVKITDKGRQKLLRYHLEEMQLDETHWDSKWRLIIYDVTLGKKSQGELFRRALNKLRLLRLQKSVYLTPFECEDQIEYLRQIFDVGRETLILKVGSIENEIAYRKYFGI